MLMKNRCVRYPSREYQVNQKIIGDLHKVVQGSDLWVIRPITHEFKRGLHLSEINQSQPNHNKSLSFNGLTKSAVMSLQVGILQ